MSKGVRLLHEDCDPSVADDTTLPNNAFLIEYLQDGITKFDIVTAAKQVDIFDYYWDNYRSDLKGMTQTNGRINPKLYNPTKKK